MLTNAGSEDLGAELRKLRKQLTSVVGKDAVAMNLRLTIMGQLLRLRERVLDDPSCRTLDREIVTTVMSFVLTLDERGQLLIGELLSRQERHHTGGDPAMLSSR
jgi:hypothetical protein